MSDYFIRCTLHCILVYHMAKFKNFLLLCENKNTHAIDDCMHHQLAISQILQTLHYFFSASLSRELKDTYEWRINYLIPITQYIDLLNIILLCMSSDHVKNDGDIRLKSIWLICTKLSKWIDGKITRQVSQDDLDDVQYHTLLILYWSLYNVFLEFKKKMMHVMLHRGHSCIPLPDSARK